MATHPRPPNASESDSFSPDSEPLPPLEAIDNVPARHTSRFMIPLKRGHDFDQSNDDNTGSWANDASDDEDHHNNHNDDEDNDQCDKHEPITNRSPPTLARLKPHVLKKVRVARPGWVQTLPPMKEGGRRANGRHPEPLESRIWQFEILDDVDVLGILSLLVSLKPLDTSVSSTLCSLTSPRVLLLLSRHAQFSYRSSCRRRSIGCLSH